MAGRCGRTAIASTVVARHGQMGGFKTQGEALQASQVALERLPRRYGQLGQRDWRIRGRDHLQHLVDELARLSLRFFGGRRNRDLRWLLRHTESLSEQVLT
jgi:hypothetical protein